MELNPDNIQAILFDYGNTLIEFGPKQVTQCDQALGAALTELFGEHDFDELTEMQHRERRAPYQGEFIENDFPELTKQIVRTLFDVEPTDEQLQHLLQVRFESMTSAIEIRPGVRELLERLKGRFKLGLVSNYPDSSAIRFSIERCQLVDLFDAVVFSGDIGHVKPHPKVFDAILGAIGVPAETCLFIGDNWLGDIQGARRCGMMAVHTTEFVPYEKFDREPDDLDATCVIEQLADLAVLC